MADGEKLFYILDTRSCCGNCALWWGPNGQGYVCDLNAAGKYTEADKRGKRETDVFVPCEVAEANVVKHVRVDVQAISPFMEQGRIAAQKIEREMKRSARRRRRG